MTDDTKPEEAAFTVAVSLPTHSAIAQHGASALEFVRSFEVDSDVTYELAGEEMNGYLKRAAQLNTQRLAITRPIDEAKERVMALFRGPVAALEEAASIIKSKMLKYSDGVRRAAEAVRLENERLAQVERDRLRAEAAALAAQGRTGEAEIKHRVSEMVVATAPPVQAAPKVSGTRSGSKVEFEVVDLLELARHVVAHPELIGLLDVCGPKLRAHVLSLGVECKTPGLRVWSASTLSGSRK